MDLGDLLSIRYRPAHSKTRPARRVSGLAGNRLSKLRGRGIDFSEVRAYQPGDDVRTIDWRVTARKNKPHTKVFREERERLTLVFVDQSQGMFFGSRARLKSVAAAEVAATAAWQALAHNDRVGGIVLGNRDAALHKPRRSVKNVARLLSDLATYNQALSPATERADPENLRWALTRLRRLAHTGYRIFIISDFEPMGDHWRDALKGLSRHNEVVAVRIFDPLERDLPPPGRYTVTDTEQRWQFHSGNRLLRKTYRERFADHEIELKTICEGSGVRYRSLATDARVGPMAEWA
ncbi:MAG TPA: DUF58 domain-containing protein [Pseudomonadales bacterium]